MTSIFWPRRRITAWPAAISCSRERLASPHALAAATRGLAAGACQRSAVLARVAALVLAAGAASGADAPALAAARLLPGKGWGLFVTGEPLSVRVALAQPPGAPQEFRLRGLDLAGTVAVDQPVVFSAGVAALDVALVAKEVRYLDLALVAAAKPDVVLASSSVAVIPADLRADSRFGFNARPELAPLAKRLGGYWLRNHIPWEQGAADKPLQGTGIEKTIAATKAGGCEVFGISSYSLPWAAVYSPDDKRNMRDYFSPPRSAPWDAYVRFAAQQIKGKVPVFEVWNEANFDMFWRSTPDTFEQRVTDYAALLKRTAPIMRAEAPGLRLTNGSIVNVRKDDPLKFLAAILAAGCGPCFDILNVHYYRAAMDPEEEAGTSTPRCPTRQFKPEGALENWLRQAQAVMAKHRQKQPMWMTEMGWPTMDPGGWGKVSELEQAWFLVRSHLICFANGVEVVQWFKLDGNDFGVVRTDLTPKPAAGAYAWMVSQLSGRTFAAALPGEGVRVYRFVGGAGDLLVAWALKPQTWSVPADMALTGASDLWGRELVGMAGKRQLSLAPAPIYLRVTPAR